MSMSGRVIFKRIQHQPPNILKKVMASKGPTRLQQRFFRYYRVDFRNKGKSYGAWLSNNSDQTCGLFSQPMAVLRLRRSNLLLQEAVPTSGVVGVSWDGTRLSANDEVNLKLDHVVEKLGLQQKPKLLKRTSS